MGIRKIVNEDGVIFTLTSIRPTSDNSGTTFQYESEDECETIIVGNDESLREVLTAEGYHIATKEELKKAKESKNND